MAAEIELFDSPDLSIFFFLSLGEVYERNVDTRDELVPRIFDAAARIKKGDQLRRKTGDLRTRVAK